MTWKPWTSEQAAELERLVGLGMTFVKIAERMGITRNAAIGKSHRLDLGKPKLPPPKPERPSFPPLDRCRFPFGDPRRPDFRFCAAVAVAGKSYCAEHHALCHVAG